MAAIEVQALDDAQRQTLETIIRPHLRLDSMPEDSGKRDVRPAQRLEDMGVSFRKPETQQVRAWLKTDYTLAGIVNMHERILFELHNNLLLTSFATYVNIVERVSKPSSCCR